MVEIVTLWERPSFSWSMRWDIVEDREHQVIFVREIKSTQSYDKLIQKEWWNNDAKELFYRDAYIGTSELKVWLGKANSISVPLVNVQGLIGYDGITYGLKYRASRTLAYSELEWWEDGPQEWQPIVQWYHDFKAWLQTELDKANSDYLSED